MALQFVGAAAANATTVTIPAGHKAGDIIFILAQRVGNTTAPALTAGWTTLSNTTGLSPAGRAAYKIATSSAETSGTWSTATGLIVAVYRGQATNKTPALATSPGSGTSATISYGQFGAQGRIQCPGSSWIIAMASTGAVGSTVSTPPVGTMINRLYVTGGSTECVVHDTNGGANGWSTANQNIGVSGVYSTVVIEVMAEFPNIENFKSFKGGDGMSFTERIR